MTLTEEIIDRICEAAAKGHHVQSCAKAVGLKYSELVDLLDIGERISQALPDDPRAVLWQRFSLAEFIHEDTILENLVKNSTKDAKVALAMLQKRYPDRWGTRGVAAPIDDNDDEETQLSRAEKMLGRAIARGEAWAITMYLNCKGRARGYGSSSPPGPAWDDDDDDDD